MAKQLTDKQLTDRIIAMRKAVEDADTAYTDSVVRLDNAADRLPTAGAVRRAEKALQKAKDAHGDAMKRLPEAKASNKALRECRKRRREWDDVFGRSF